MRTLRSWLLVVVLLLTLGLSAGSSFAQTPSPDAAIQAFVDRLYADQVSLEEAQAFLDGLDNRQQDVLLEMMAIKVGVDPDLARRERDEHQRLLMEMEKEGVVSGSLDVQMPVTPSPDGYGFPSLWRQSIENKSTIGGPPGDAAWANLYVNDPECEHDFESDPDPDWRFNFPMNYSANPDGLRWTTSDTQVFLAFMAAYGGGNLNGFAWSWDHAMLCLGTTGVSMAGGPDRVKNTLYLTPNN